MKRLTLLIIIFTGLILFHSCDNDVDINADYKDIVIVYGILDPHDNGTYLKINKAFLGPDNALTMAKIPDSSQFLQKLNVTITNTSNSTVYTFDTITISNKEDGIFYNPYQQLYYNPFVPAPDTRYTLKVIYKDKEITSETYSIEEFNTLDITKPGFAKAITFIYDQVSPVIWFRQDRAPRYDVTINFSWKELWEGQTDTVYRSIEWFKDTQIATTGEEVETFYSANTFYNALEAFVPYDDPDTESQVMERYFGRVEFIVEAGGTELNTYMEVNEPSSSIVQERPQYTNIENGYGLFSARARANKIKKLSDQTKSTIKEDFFYLKFQF
jgi:hypothetical protein